MKAHHIDGEPGDIARYVLCPGSQARARLIAAEFEGCRTISTRRGIEIYSGHYRGTFMTACGTGMGGPAASIAVEELGQLGADTFLRVGSCGAVQKTQKPGEIVVATGTYRGGGTGDEYLPVRFPAVPSFSVVRALVETAEADGIPVTVGVGSTFDSFYGPLSYPEMDALADAGMTFVEMEADTVFLVGQVRGWRTGAVFVIDGTVDEIKPASGRAAVEAGTATMVRLALDAIIRLAERDRLEHGG